MKVGHDSAAMIMFQDTPTIIAGYDGFRVHRIVENFVTDTNGNRKWQLGAKYPL